MEALQKKGDVSQVTVTLEDKNYTYQLPFTGVVPVSNSLVCLTTFVALGIPIGEQVESL